MTCIADTNTEVEYVKFCPECSSDNIDPHPDENIYLQFEPEDQKWYQCQNCKAEFQLYEATLTPEIPITLWNNERSAQ